MLLKTPKMDPTNTKVFNLNYPIKTKILFQKHSLM